MPRKYKRKTTRASYSEDDLQRALAEVAAGAPLKSTAKQYGIAPKTLRRHRDGKVLKPGSVSLGRFRPDLGKEYEDELVSHIRKMEKALFGMTTRDVRRLAFDYATKLGLNHRFNTSNKMAGPDWLRGFLSRHPDLSIRKPEAMNISRAIGFNKPQVQRFFSFYKEILTTHTYSPMRVWNMDETGISTVQTPAKIIATKGAREVGKMTSGERGKNVTIVCATNAAGSYIPPMFIFPRKRMVDTLLNNAPAGAIGHCTASGWADDASFIKWLKHFTSVAKPTTEERHVIILDGHHSHKTLQAVDYARSNGIDMITLPPHCTHKLQPLDKTFFKALKNSYNAAADTWMVAHPGKRITFYDIAEIFAVAYNKTATIEKSVNGFRACGLWPFNDNVFSDDDFTASDLTNEPEPQDAQNNPTTGESGDDEVDPPPSSQQIPVLRQLPPSDMVELRVTDGQQEPQQQACSLVTDQHMEQPEQSTNTDPITGLSGQPLVEATQPGTSRRSQDTSVISGDVILPDAPTTSLASTSSPNMSKTTQPTATSTAKDVLSQLCPPMKAVKMRTRKRKTERAEKITASPYKKFLEEASKTKGKGIAKKQHKKKTKRKKYTENANNQSSDEDDEWPCLVCGEPYSNSKPREKWVQCITCHHWAHEDCTTGDRYYICQNCDSDDEDDNE